MSAKHTPGPWAVRGHNAELPQVWDSAFDVCITDRVFNGNANLIAAAPELLAACKYAMGALLSARFDTAAYDSHVTACERAIAKAERGQQ